MWWWGHGKKHFMWKFGWLMWPLGWLAYVGVGKGITFIGDNPIILGVALALAIPFLFLGMGIQLVKGWQANYNGPLKRKNETLEKRKNDDKAESRRFLRGDDGELIEIT